MSKTANQLGLAIARKFNRLASDIGEIEAKHPELAAVAKSGISAKKGDTFAKVRGVIQVQSVPAKVLERYKALVKEQATLSDAMLSAGEISVYDNGFASHYESIAADGRKVEKANGNTPAEEPAETA